MTSDDRKKLLTMACTVDRLELLLVTRRPVRAVHTAASFLEMPWMGLTLSTLSLLLPRKLQWVTTVLKVVRKQLESPGGRGVQA